MPTDACDFYRWMWLCYDAGRADASGESLLPLNPGDRAIVDLVRADWQLRMARDLPPAERPGWLEALVEATPEAIERLR